MIVEEYETVMATSALEVGGSQISVRTNMQWATAAADDCWAFVSDGDGTGTIVLEVPLGDAVSFWHPYAHWNRTTLPPDWMGKTSTSLIHSTPMGCLYSHAGRTLLGYALDAVERRVDLRFGVSEETKSFVVCIDLVGTPAQHPVRLKLAAGRPADETIQGLAGWLAGRADQPVAGSPSFAREPVYSTWYGFHHEIDERVLDIEAARAADLGFGSMFVDFGWQQRSVGRRFEGCGDWIPEQGRFPDFRGFVDRTHAKGLAVVAWVAPFLLGQRSRAFERLRPMAPHHDPVLDASILDPRFPAVREHLAQTLAGLVETYDLDGLKIDFLETAMAYRDTPSGGDVDDVGTATRLMLEDLRVRFARDGRPDLLIEFRQPYISPALARYANVLRAEDCPGDAVHNRNAMLDARLGTKLTVHSDMMMWDPGLSVEAVVRHLHSSLFAVPQISTALATTPARQIAGIRAWLELWRELRSTLLDGTLHAARPHANYPVVWAIDPDGARAVVAVYEPDTVVKLPVAAETIIVNATAATELWVAVTTDGRHRATAFDILGTGTELEPIDGPGLHRIQTPESGHLRLTQVVRR